MIGRIVLLVFILIAGSAPTKASQIFPLGSSWKYFLGTQEASFPTDAWRALDFDDSGWTNGVAPRWDGRTGHRHAPALKHV